MLQGHRQYNSCEQTETFSFCLGFMVHVLCVFCLKQRITPVPRQTKGEFDGFLNMIGVGTTIHHSKDCMDVQVTEVEGQASSDICNIKLITDGEFMELIVLISSEFRLIVSI